MPKNPNIKKVEKDRYLRCWKTFTSYKGKMELTL